MQITCVWNGEGNQYFNCVQLACFLAYQNVQQIWVTNRQFGKFIQDLIPNSIFIPYANQHDKIPVDQVFILDSSRSTYQIAKHFKGKRFGIKSSLSQVFSKSVSIKKFQSEETALEALFEKIGISVSQTQVLEFLNSSSNISNNSFFSDLNKESVLNWLQQFPYTLDWKLYTLEEVNSENFIYQTDWNYQSIISSVLIGNQVIIHSKFLHKLFYHLNIEILESLPFKIKKQHYQELLLPNRIHTSEVIERIKRKEVVLMNTDTVPGLHALASSESAVEQIYDIKNRPKVKRCIILVSGIQMLRDFNHSVPQEFIQYEERHNTATTLLIPAGWGVPEYLISEEGLIAVRVPVSERLRKLIDLIGEPIVSTSANISGEEHPNSLSEVSQEIQTSVSMTFQEEFADSPSKGKSSKIIQISENKLTVIRE